MNPLVKKEVRLLLPAWIVAMLLAMVQACTRPYDFYIAFLVFFGLSLMALTSIGRETSLNTFSSMLAQPGERERIWKVKLSVLFIAFLTVFLTWFVAFVVANIHAVMNQDEFNQEIYLLVTVCLSFTATFTGGLWSTLLIRQVAGALWLTLLVPAVLCGIAGAFLSTTDSDSYVIAGLSIVIAVYSVGGFFFARWLFFRAQDVGWTGGVIVLPEWNAFGAVGRAGAKRRWNPLVATVKKELQLQPATLIGAAIMLVIHAGIILWRRVHPPAKNSDWEMVASAFWLLWLALPVVIGATAIAEERKLGVSESQLCLPVSRRFQFVVKFVITMLLGLFLGGFMPLFLEAWGIFGTNSVFGDEHRTGGDSLLLMQIAIFSLAGWLALSSFLASSLTRNFLQALGCAMGIMVACPLIFAAVLGTYQGGVFHSLLWVPKYSLLPVIVVVPVMVITFIVFSWFNFKTLYQGWPLWKKNLLAFALIVLATDLAIPAIYHRAWEAFEPVEPPHGPPVLARDQAPSLNVGWGSLQARLPDGRVWIGVLMPGHGLVAGMEQFIFEKILKVSPDWNLPRATVDPRFVAGSNWVSVVTDHVYFATPSYGQSGKSEKSEIIRGYLDTVGIKSDGTLWVADRVGDGAWNGGHMVRFGAETNWAGVGRLGWGLLLLKKDGTLWHWGGNSVNLNRVWVDYRNLPLRQVGTESDWKEIEPGRSLLRKNDGTTWSIWYNNHKTNDLGLEIDRHQDLDHLPFKNMALSSAISTAYYIDDQGDLWFTSPAAMGLNNTRFELEKVHLGTDAKWKALAASWRQMVAIKADGTLWQWPMSDALSDWQPYQTPQRLGIHDDWVALTEMDEGIATLAADGSLWFWPNPALSRPLMEFPKQPVYLGNVLQGAN